MSNSDDEVIKFNSVEQLSLYTTMVLKRLTTDVQPIEDYLPHLIHVLDHNLKNMKVEKKWFFGTLRDHARLFDNEWRLNNVDGPDRGIIAYNTLLLVVILKLGLEKLWITGSVTQVYGFAIIDHLTALFYPKKPVLSLKYLNQCHGLFDYLSSHSPGLEEVYIPRSDVTAFQNSMKFKNLRVLELGGRISDKVLCYGLWNINKKSDKVLEMALKESKGLDSWLLSLPHLEVLRNNFLDHHNTNTMKVSLGAAALLIQPKMETVEAVTSWETPSAIMHLLDTEAKMKNFSVNNRVFKLTKLEITYDEMENIDDEWLQRLFKACPKLSDLKIQDSDIILSHLDVLVELFHKVPLRKLELDTANMKHLDLAALLVAATNLTDLTLHTTPLDLAMYHDLLPDRTTLYASPYSSVSLLIRPEKLPRDLDSLSLNFGNTDLDEDIHKGTKCTEDFKHFLKSFLSKFGAVKKLNFYNTSLLPASYLVFGGIGAALEELQHIKHLTVISCDYIPWEDNQHIEDSESASFLSHHYNRAHSHSAEVRRLLPQLQKEATFHAMCRLESLELDAMYLSPRVDRMIAALRAAGVLVNIFYSSNKYCENIFNRAEKKRLA